MTFPGFLAAGGKVLRGDPCDPCTLISETKCLYLSLRLQPNKQSSGHSPNRSNLREWSEKKKAPRHPKEIKAIPAYPNIWGEWRTSICRANGSCSERVICPHPRALHVHPPLHQCTRPSPTSITTPYTPLEVEFTTSLWNDGLWNHLASFNPVRCASVFQQGLWRRKACHLLPLARYKAGPYDFCDAKNTDGIMESRNENIYCIMWNVTNF